MTVVQNDVLRVTAEMDETNVAVQNVMHFRSTNSSTIPDATALSELASVMDTVYTPLPAQLSTGFSFNQVRVQNVTQSILLGTAPFPVLTAGLNASALLPRPVAALITLPTNVPKVRGGVYLGGFTEAANVAPGTIAVATITQIALVAAELLIEHIFGVNSYRYVVFNTILKTFALPTASIVPGIWRTQRRRRVGVGI